MLGLGGGDTVTISSPFNSAGARGLFLNRLRSSIDRARLLRERLLSCRWSATNQELRGSADDSPFHNSDETNAEKHASGWERRKTSAHAFGWERRKTSAHAFGWERRKTSADASCWERRKTSDANSRKDRCFLSHGDRNTVCWKRPLQWLFCKSPGAEADELACMLHTSERASDDVLTESADPKLETRAHDCIDSECVHCCSTCNSASNMDGIVQVESCSDGEEHSINSVAEAMEVEAHHEMLPLLSLPLESTEVGVLPTQPLRLACPKGSRCRNRDISHTSTHAHPLDLDYVACCEASGLEPQPLSLKTVFDWIDADGSGRLSREELEASMGIMRERFDDWPPEMTDQEWCELDEDGNGVANFGEFACWAEPRLGLPLGMDKMRHSTQSLPTHCSPCNVSGCSCREFEPCKWRRWKCVKCGHHQQFHKLQTIRREEVPFPSYWANHEGVFNTLVRLSKSEVRQFQRFVDITYSNKYTRDRRRHNPQAPKVPRGYRVRHVFRNENCLNWREYGCRRAELLTRLQEEEELRLQGPRRLLQTKSTAAWKEIAGVKANAIEEQCNEWYVFHGTSPEVAQLICNTDFKVHTAGSNTGTLYGRGLYFAESITKADEYAQADKHGHYAVLLCRVMGGRVLYTDEAAPDSEMLAKACIEGPYNCVLGDRERCRGTYREFVFFDSEDVYPEYVIHYQRVFNASGKWPFK